MIETSSDLPRSSSAIFEKCSETFVWPLEQFWKIFGNVRKVVANLWKIVKNSVFSIFIYFFPRGHGNESCNLTGS